MRTKQITKIIAVTVFLLGQSVFAQNIEERTSTPDTNVAVPISDDQTTDETNNTIHSMAGIEIKPEFPGGMAQFYKFVNKNFNVPSEFKGKGKVFVTFVVEKDGSLSNIKILRDVGYSTGQEVLRILKNSPKWIPGEQNGKKLRIQYALPIEIDSTRK